MPDIPNNSVGFVETHTIRLVEQDQPLELQCGRSLAPVDVAYETYGSLNEAGDNTVLICHALSGDAHVAGCHTPQDKKPGWWDAMVGPGKGIDTSRYFVICSNLLGGCSGTTGPSSPNPQTNKPYGLDFPIITIADMVKVQKLLLDRLGIKGLLAVVGGSIGGMQVLQWAIDYPDFVKAAIPIATTSRLGAQSIAFDAVGRNAILADPNFASGQYHNEQGPDTGLAIARMIGHLTYLSEQAMRNKFGRKLRSARQYRYDLNSEFAVETYLDYQGQTFVERFDANSYLYITKAADYFDLDKGYGSLTKAFENVLSRFLVVSFESDWLFTPAQSEEIVNALIANGKDVSFCNVASSYGHDAFLLETEVLGDFLAGFLDAAHRPGVKKIADMELINHRRTSRSQAAVTNPYEQARRTRVDHELIESLIRPNSRILDVGCGDGELLTRLTEDMNITSAGIEFDQDLVLLCVSRGLSVIQYDVERGLAGYADRSFDYCLLSQTLQTLKDPEKVFTELLRVGRKVIVSFPNFANWRCRARLLLTGKAPVTGQLPSTEPMMKSFGWHNSPNIHFLSLKDFDDFCGRLGAKIEKKIPLIKTSLRPVRFAPNLFAEQAVYVTSRG